jgi:hypothetical protein
MGPSVDRNSLSVEALAVSTLPPITLRTAAASSLPTALEISPSHFGHPIVLE